MSAAFTPKVKAFVLERSSGLCEVASPRAGCQGQVHHLHHRKLRSQGGPGTAANCLAVCWACHTYIHADTGNAYQQGWLVHGWEEIGGHEVLYRGRIKTISAQGAIEDVEEK